MSVNPGGCDGAVQLPVLLSLQHQLGGPVLRVLVQGLTHQGPPAEAHDAVLEVAPWDGGGDQGGGREGGEGVMIHNGFN